jgi:hypothetical protein
MTDSLDDPFADWPPLKNQIGSAPYVHAIGQITLAYNGLENLMASIFCITLPVEYKFAEKVFHSMHNRERTDLLSALLKNQKDDELRDALQHVVLCYDICTDNRNIVMHSILEEITPSLPKLRKRASQNPAKLLEFHVPLGMLRRVADQILETFNYGFFVWIGIQNQSAGASLSLAPLPQKPPKPHKLIPYQPPEADKDAPPQPQPSGG